MVTIELEFEEAVAVTTAVGIILEIGSRAGADKGRGQRVHHLLAAAEVKLVAEVSKVSAPGATNG